MDYLEFIARVTSHIPVKVQVMVRYYGLYAGVPFIRLDLRPSDRFRLIRMGNLVRNPYLL